MTLIALAVFYIAIAVFFAFLGLYLIMAAFDKYSSGGIFYRVMCISAGIALLALDAITILIVIT